MSLSRAVSKSLHLCLYLNHYQIRLCHVLVYVHVPACRLSTACVYVSVCVCVCVCVCVYVYVVCL